MSISAQIGAISRIFRFLLALAKKQPENWLRQAIAIIDFFLVLC